MNYYKNYKTHLGQRKKKSGNGEVSYAKGDTNINAKLDTTNAAILEEVELTHGLKVQGKSLTLTPKYVSEGQKGSLSARLLDSARTLARGPVKVGVSCVPQLPPS